MKGLIIKGNEQTLEYSPSQWTNAIQIKKKKKHSEICTDFQILDQKFAFKVK